jgi:hypothetical protein
MPSETTTAQPNSPAAKPQTSEVTKGSTSPETFTKEQVDELQKKAVRDALAEAGRQHKTERESAVAKALENQAATIKEHVDRIKELEADLDVLSKDDTDKSEVLKLKREIRAEKDSLAKDRDSFKTEKESHDKEWQDNIETIKLAKSESFALTAWDIADEYEGGNAVQLKEICEDAEKLTEEFARKTAARLWVKKTEVKKPLVEGKPDNGGTQGGASSWETIRDAYSANPNDPVIKAQYLDARRKRGI